MKSHKYVSRVDRRGRAYYLEKDSGKRVSKEKYEQAKIRQKAALKATKTRRENQKRAEEIRQRRSEASRRAWEIRRERQAIQEEPRRKKVTPPKRKSKETLEEQLIRHRMAAAEIESKISLQGEKKKTKKVPTDVEATIKIAFKNHFLPKTIDEEGFETLVGPPEPEYKVTRKKALKALIAKFKLGETEEYDKYKQYKRAIYWKEIENAKKKGLTGFQMQQFVASRVLPKLYMMSLEAGWTELQALRFARLS